MRILHLFPGTSWGGAEIQAIEICDWQREIGLDSRFWCAEGTPIHKEVLRRGIPCVTEPFPMKGLLPPLARLRRVLRQNQITHLHVHWAAGVRLVYGIKFLLPVKLIFYTHMWITRRKMDPFHRLAYKAFDKVTISGQRAYENVQKFLPWNKKQLEICPYGIDFRKIPEGLRMNQAPAPGLRKKWGLPEDALIFGFFGRIDRQKGVKEFLVASQKALANHPNLHLLLVGDPTLNEPEAVAYNQEIVDLIEASPYRSRIHRIPHQREFHSPIACADLAVLPSYMECYSILIVHCFALGLPVVSTDAGGTPDLIQAPRRGWLVPSRDTEILGELLDRLAGNPSGIREKAEACQAYARNHHSHDSVARRFKEIYEAAEKNV